MVGVLLVSMWKLIAAPLVIVHLVIINEPIKATFLYRIWHSGFGSTDLYGSF